MKANLSTQTAELLAELDSPETSLLQIFVQSSSLLFGFLLLVILLA